MTGESLTEECSETEEAGFRPEALKKSEVSRSWGKKRRVNILLIYHLVDIGWLALELCNIYL